MNAPRDLPGLNSAALAPEDAARMIAALEASGSYQVLRRFESPPTVTPSGRSDTRVVMVVDTETTGKNSAADKVFEIGYLLAEYEPDTGRVLGVVDRYSGFDDPGFPLPEIIVKLTGVTYAEVEGQRFDDDRIRRDIARADLVIAQNANFDRQFLEPIFPEFAAKNWGCTREDSPWEAMGVNTTKQEFLAFQIGRMFYEAHRALTDAEVLLDIVRRPAHDGRPIFASILESAHRPTFRVWAVNSPFESKDILKVEGGYHWSDGTEKGKLKAWHKNGVQDLQAELDFLARIYPKPQKIAVDLLTAAERFSSRYRERKELEITPAAPVAAPARPKP